MPTFDGGTPKGTVDDSYVYNCGQGVTQQTWTGITDPQTVKNYLTALEEKGFVLISANTTDVGNEFYSYRYGKTGVHISWLPDYAGGTFRIIKDVAGYQPSQEEEKTTAVVTPTVAQLKRTGAAASPPGMSYVIQLSDGRFIIIDGGPDNADDRKALMDYLTEANKTTGLAKPTIAGWFFTHAHGDHMSLANQFLRVYGDQIVLQGVFANFPALGEGWTCTKAPADPPGMTTEYTNYLARLKEKSPTTPIYKFQTGESFWLGDAKIDILFTHQDYYHQGTGSSTTAFKYGNDTSAAFRITVNGYKMIFTGDSDLRACPTITAMYGTDLDCHIMQVPHHGLNGGDQSMYDAMAPDLCFWPIDSGRFDSTSGCLNPEYTYNVYLQQEASYVTSGHYHASQTTVVNLSNGEITVDGVKQTKKLTK